MVLVKACTKCELVHYSSRLNLRLKHPSFRRDMGDAFDVTGNPYRACYSLFPPTTTPHHPRMTSDPPVFLHLHP